MSGAIELVLGVWVIFVNVSLSVIFRRLMALQKDLAEAVTWIRACVIHEHLLVHDSAAAECESPDPPAPKI